MDRKTYSIGILTLTAVVMLTGLLFAPTPAQAIPAGVVVRDRDYAMLTGTIQGGGDALFVLDNRRGTLAVFTFDNSSRTLKLRTAEPVANAFKGGR